jgi:hypothetical protein
MVKAGLRVARWVLLYMNTRSGYRARAACTFSGWCVRYLRGAMCW